MRKGTLVSPHKNVDYMSHVFGAFSGIAAGVFINKKLDLKREKPAIKDNKKKTIALVR